MQRLLYIMIGMPSCYNSGLELCRRLADSGMVVLIACNRDVEAMVSAAGFEFHWLRADHDRLQLLEESLHSHRALPLPLRLLKRVQSEGQQRQASLQNAEIESLVSTVSPDVLLIDIECHVAIINSRTSGIPTVLCSRWFDIVPSTDYPPLHSLLIPSGTAKTRWRAHWQWQNLWLRKWCVRAREFLSLARWRPLHYRTFQYDQLGCLARAKGVSLRGLINRHHWLIPFAYRELPVLSLTARSLDFPHPFDPGHHYLGPMVPERNHAFEASEADAQRLSHFVGHIRSQGARLLYCSLGTWLTAHGPLLDALVALMRTRRDLALVIGLGGQPYTASSAVPDNVLLLSSAPQIDLLCQADLALLHAGIGSLNEALWHAVPSLVFSVQTNDQNGCAARIRFHQLGRVMSLEEISVEILARTIDDTLADTALKLRLQRFRNALIADADPALTAQRVRVAAGMNVQQLALARRPAGTVSSADDAAIDGQSTVPVNGQHRPLAP